MTQVKHYFGTDGIRARIGEKKINPDFVLHLGWALGKVFARNGSSVVIGKDTRISGYMIESALQAGLAAAGSNVMLLGPLPTPGIAYLTRALRAQAGIVISASHNLHPDNGIKVFSKQGFKVGDDVELAIENYLGHSLQCVSSQYLGKATRVKDAQGRYIEFCKSSVPFNMRLDHMKIVIDCANGAGYNVAPNVFHELGAKVIEHANHPDGYNINDQCGSTQPETLQRLVINHGADLGMALDGDGDRVILVDHLGHIVDGDDILYVIMQHMLARKQLKGGIAGTIMTNYGLELACQRHNVPFRRAKVGDRHVMETLLQQDWRIGGEPSGHIVNLDKTTSGDGIITALEVLAAMQYSGQSLHELTKQLEKFPHQLVNIEAPAPHQIVDHPQTQQAIRQVEHELGDSGRVLIRPSGTEPVIRVMVEGEDDATVQHHIATLVDAINQVKIDQSTQGASVS